MKKVICFVLAVTIIMCCCSGLVSADNAKYAVNTSREVDNDFIQNNLDSNVSYTNFILSIKEELTDARANTLGSQDETSSQSYTVNGIGEGEYPNYYAGAYTNTYGNLVFLLDSKLASQRDAVINEIYTRSKSDAIIIRYAKYSYNELIGVMNTIQHFMSENISDGCSHNSIFKITGAAIDDYRNCVVVYLNDLSDTSIKWFKQNVIDTEAISFAEKKEYDTVAATLNCGGSITTNNRSFSLGFRAKKTLSSGTVVNGFITCGHATIGVTSNIPVYHNSSSIGTLNSNMNRCNGTIDAAFVTLSSGSEVNSRVSTDLDIYNIGTQGWILPTVGSIVYMYGASSAAAVGTLRVGVIEYQSYIATYNLSKYGLPNRQISDLVMANYTTLEGDSGGIVFASSSGAYYATGTVGAFFTDSSGCHSLYCKALNIMDAFDVAPR